MELKVVNVVGAVIIENNKLYTTERGYGDWKSWFEFPGGKIELGETPEEALKREMMEELNVLVEVGELVDTIDYDYPTFHLHMKCFRCNIVDGELTLLEHSSSRWLSKKELYSVKWLPADEGTVKKIEKMLV